MDEYLWGDAAVTFPDWKGTAQLDERMTIPWAGLAKAVGLERDQWQVIGFSIGGGEHGYSLEVVATPRDVWERDADNPAKPLEATMFYIDNVDPLAILQAMTHSFDLRMVIGAVHGREILIRPHASD